MKGLLTAIRQRLFGLTKEQDYALAPDAFRNGEAGASEHLAGGSRRPVSEKAFGSEEAVEFDEVWYLFKNPDVARHVKASPGRSALRHYLNHGEREGRSPLPPPGWDRSEAEKATMRAKADGEAAR